MSRSGARAATAGAGQPAQRTDGYAPIADYAAIGDGRTVALIALDGSIDWLCLPDLDSPTAFGALLDAGQGGSFQLAPDVPFTAERRYVPDTNVLETTFFTESGVVRVTDAMLLPLSGLAPARELARQVEGISGSVPLTWSVRPRFGYAESHSRIERRGEVPVATAGREAAAIWAWSAGSLEFAPQSVGGRFASEAGERSLLLLAAADGDTLILPSRPEVENRLGATIRFWSDWARSRAHDGPWREAVARSALALKLLIHAPSGAIAGAATTSLPETLGGERNWDYRFSWIRDSAFTLDALLRLGCTPEAEAFFWWLLHASQLTHPRLRVLYRLNGRPRSRERNLRFEGYRGSHPARVGNEAAEQLQLDIYGHLFKTAWLYVRSGGELPADAGRRLAQTADLVCELWRRPDSGIWEVRSEAIHFTESKMMCWTALDRALGLAEDGHIPGGAVRRWRAEARTIAEFIERRCWSVKLGSYCRHAGGSAVDASLLLGVLMGYRPARTRLTATVERIRHDLGRGPLLYRYLGEDGLGGAEGAFLPCSFWLADALARLGRLDEAGELMDELVGLANEVGLYAEEIDPASGAFLGNFPQGLAHLGLINAAITIEKATAE